MDLSSDTLNLKEQFNCIKRRSQQFLDAKYNLNNSYEILCDNGLDIIDINHIQFENDETWLYMPETVPPSSIQNLHTWLKSDMVPEEFNDEEFLSNRLRLVQEVSKIENQKFDPRTFVRKKKPYTRPSIEKYNEQVYGYDSSSNNEMDSSTDGLKKSADSGVFLNQPMLESNEIQLNKSLQFDLGQPTTSFYFENLAAKASDIVDSFQNMSPPSLVNSMCSSTFANLMESSFIKNDPVLREIRDTDYSALLQDSEPPLFQSFTESCSSINSDSPENFLKKASMNGTFNKTLVKEMEKSKEALGAILVKDEECVNTTFVKEDAENEKSSNKSEIFYDSSSDKINFSNQKFNNNNGTYRRPSKNSPSSKSQCNSTTIINNQVVVADFPKPTMTAKTETKLEKTISKQDTIEEIKKRYSDPVTITTDSNRWSHVQDEDDDKYFNTSNDLNATVTVDSTSNMCSAGSADSLDRISSLSNSSRGSNRMLNLADVETIVEMQERSLQQVMSTPKHQFTHYNQQQLWSNACISPITMQETNSDSDVSSNDDYKSVRSSVSKVSLDNYVQPKNVKSLNYIENKIELNKKQMPRSTYTMTNNTRNVQNGPSNLRGSYGVGPGLSASQTRLNRPPPTNNKPSNLKTMGHNLKGSYTSLKPINTHLPVAPPLLNTKPTNSTVNLSKASNANVTQIVKVGEVPQVTEKIQAAGGDVFVKPQPPRTSGLPRPLGSGIPRPSASRIPGPRVSSIRPHSSRPSKQFTDG